MKYFLKFTFLLISFFIFSTSNAQDSESLVKDNLLNLTSFETALSNSELTNNDYKKLYTTLLFYVDKVKADESLKVLATEKGWIQRAEEVLINLKKNL